MRCVALGTAALVAAAACLDPPSQAPGGGGDDGGAPGGDGAPDGCEPILVDTFEDDALNESVWSDEDATVAPVVAGGVILLETDGDLDGDATSEIWTHDTFDVSRLTVTVDVDRARIDAGGTVLVELSENNDVFYSFYGSGNELRVFDSGDALCDPECPDLLEAQSQRWRFHPIEDSMSFEIATDGAWEVIDTAPLRAAQHRLAIHADTDVAGDFARLRLQRVTVADCAE